MMFSNYGNNDQDNNHNTNNEIGETAALIITSEYLDDTNRNYSCFSSPNSINSHNSIFIQPSQIETYNSNESSGHEHLMILASAAVNSSPSSNSYKSISNTIEPTIINNSDSPHFSIRDPPLIRLSPTSPNNIFRNDRYNIDYQGITNESHNTEYSQNNVDWHPQELYVKTDTTTEELTHSTLKRHSFNNSLSDTDFSTLQSQERGRAWARDNYPQPASNLRQRADLKRRRLYTPRSDISPVVNAQIFTPTSVDDFTANLTTNAFINLTESDDEVSSRERLTPELPHCNVHWWPIKRHCPGPISDDNTVDPITNTDDGTLSDDIVTSSEDIQHPTYGVRHVPDPFSPLSPPIFVCTSNNGQPTDSYQDHNSSHTESRDNLRCPSSTNEPLDRSTPLQMRHDHVQQPTSNASSYHLRHVFVPQFCNRRPYVASNVHPGPFHHDFSRLFVPLSHSDRPCPYRSMSQSALLDPGRNNHDHFLHAALADLDTRTMHTNHSPSLRSSRLSGSPSHLSDDRRLLIDAIYQPITTQAQTNTFLRAYELEQRRMQQVHDSPQDPRLRNDQVRLHPLMRISERSFPNSMLDSRYGSHYHRQLGVPGNVESVIQLALHLETSWRGISAEEFARLPCHYFGRGTTDTGTSTGTDTQDKCMVCLDEFVTDDELRTLCCGHQYHVLCVDKWLKMNRTCPMCRSDAVVGSSNYVFANQ